MQGLNARLIQGLNARLTWTCTGRYTCVHSNGTSTHYGEQLCKIILKSIHIYIEVEVRTNPDRWTDAHTHGRKHTRTHPHSGPESRLWVLIRNKKMAQTAGPGLKYFATSQFSVYQTTIPPHDSFGC